MLSLRSRIQRRWKQTQKSNVLVNFLEDDLPLAEKPKPVATTVLRGHRRPVNHAVAIPESGLIATASYSELGLRIFALDGDGEPLHVCLGTKVAYRRSLAALGGDVLAYGDTQGNISTWCASVGVRLDTCQLGIQESPTAMAKLGPGKFVVGTGGGAIVFFSHRDGRNLHEAGRGSVSHGDWIGDIAVCGDAIVTASGDGTAAVWSAATRERVATLSGLSDWVMCAAVSARFIATGSFGGTLRLYEARAGHALIRVFEGLHNFVDDVGFVGDDMLMSASLDNTVAFTSIPSGKPVARLNAGFPVLSASITPDDRIACVGLASNAVVFPPPALVATAVMNHAAIVFSPDLPLNFSDDEPLQAAIVEFFEGSRGVGDACRALVRKENCSRSIEEWASAHRLLMSAVERNEIPGQLDFEGVPFYWFKNLYKPSKSFELGGEDLSLVEKYVFEAKRAGVISEPQAVLPSVLGGQDNLKKTSKLLVSGQKIISVMWQVMARQAENDTEMRKLLPEVKTKNRHQKLIPLFSFVLSFVPLGGNSLAQGHAGVEHVWSLLDSTLSAGVGNQGAITSLILDHFVQNAASLIALAGWKALATEDHVMFQDAVQVLDISWNAFCHIIQKAASQRGLEAARAIEGGDKTVAFTSLSEFKRIAPRDAFGKPFWSESTLASVCYQVVEDDFPFLLDELRSVCNLNNSKRASEEPVWPFQTLFEMRGVSLIRWEAAPKGCEEISEPDWLMVEQVAFGFVVQSSSGVDYFLFFKGGRLTKCGLKLFLSLVLPCERSLAVLRQMGSLHSNCLLTELKVPISPKGTHVYLAVHSGWLEYVSNQRDFVEEHVVRYDKELVVVGPKSRKTRKANGVQRVREIVRTITRRRVGDMRSSTNDMRLNISKIPDELAESTSPIPDCLQMRDGSYFYVPKCTPSQEMPSEYPKLIFRPKKEIVFAGGQETKTNKGGFQAKVYLGKERKRTTDLQVREVFSEQDYLQKNNTFPIINLARLNYLFPAPEYPERPELDERVRVFSRALADTGGFIVDRNEVSSCWYHAITGPYQGGHLQCFKFSEGTNAIKVEALNYIDYTISRIGDARSYAFQKGREDAFELLERAENDVAYVIFVHSNSSNREETRLALFLGRNERKGVRCNLVVQLDPGIPIFRPRRCNASGEIGGSDTLNVLSIDGNDLV